MLLFEVSVIKSGKAPESFTSNCDELAKEGYYSMLTMKDRAGEQDVAFKPVIALKIGNARVYYMAQSSSPTEFNVTSKANGQMKYVRVNPQGERGRSLAYFDQENFNQQQQQVDLPFLKALRKSFRISKGGLNEVINHMKGMGIRVHTLREMEIFMQQHPELFGKDSVHAYIDINDIEEVEVLRKDLFAKFKNKSSYGCVGRTANYWYLCDYFGESSYKIRAQIQINGNEDLLNAIEKNLGNGTFRDAEDFIRRVRIIEASYRQYQDGGVDVTITRAADGDAALDGRQYKTGNNQGTSDGQSAGYNGQTISTAEDWNRDVQLLQTPSGEVYGFAYQGEIYIDETKLDPQAPVHEYTHIWESKLEPLVIISLNLVSILDGPLGTE